MSLSEGSRFRKEGVSIDRMHVMRDQVDQGRDEMGRGEGRGGEAARGWRTFRDVKKDGLAYGRDDGGRSIMQR